MNDLTQKHCVPCEKGSPSLTKEKENELLRQTPKWLLLRNDTHKLHRQFKLKNFRDAMKFVNKVADIAESEGHHPDIKIVYNKVQLDLFTHAVSGLSENDFIMASKINKLS